MCLFVRLESEKTLSGYTLAVFGLVKLRGSDPTALETQWPTVRPVDAHVRSWTPTTSYVSCECESTELQSPSTHLALE